MKEREIEMNVFIYVEHVVRPCQNHNKKMCHSVGTGSH